MNTAHNLSVDELIRVFQSFKINGVQYLDATVHSDFDIGFKPSNYSDPEPPTLSLKDVNLIDVT